VGSTGGKKVKGRKRHILVDTMGNLLLVMVPSAGWSDQEGGTWLLVKALHRFGTVLKVWADSASRGDLITLIRDLFEVDLEVVRKDPNQEGVRRPGEARGRGAIAGMVLPQSTLEQGL
jgi:putative transposase